MAEESRFYRKWWAEPPLTQLEPIPPDETLVRRLREAGADAIDAVPCFAGLYPMSGGYGGLSLEFTRQRLAVCLGDGTLSVWGAYTGPSPTKPLGTFRRPDVRLIRTDWPPYDRWQFGTRKLWIHRRFRTTILAWLIPDNEA
ncbi:hypothetical protein BH10ACT8_BH10ACT8_23790 [soil metagenome]